jgi:hypothetical protein
MGTLDAAFDELVDKGSIRPSPYYKEHENSAAIDDHRAPLPAMAAANVSDASSSADKTGKNTLDAKPSWTDAQPRDDLTAYMDSLAKFDIQTADDVPRFQSFASELGNKLKAKIDGMANVDPTAPAVRDKGKWEHAAATGDFVSRNDPVGNAFNYDLKSDPIEAKLWKDAKAGGKEAKLLMKKNWATRRFAKMQSERTHSETFRTIDEEKGSYMTFGQIVVALGGWEWTPAIQGARNVVSQCIAMQGKWVSGHKQAQLPLYLFLQRQYSELHEQAWTLFQKEYNDATDVIADNIPQATGKATAKVKAKGQPKVGKAVTGADPAASPPSGGNGFKETLKEAQELKRAYAVNTAKAVELIQSINGDGTYAMFKTDVMLGALEKRLKTVTDGLSEFGRQFIIQDLKEIKKKFDINRIEFELKGFLTLKANVSKLEEKISEINRKHAA